MAKGIPIDEKLAQRRRRSQTSGEKVTGPLANGHDLHEPRVLKLEGWHELGEVEAQDGLVADILGPQQLAMIYGESGSGKSFATFDMFAHYALRWDWLGHKIRGSGACLYIAAEGRGGWSNRVDAFCLHHKLDEEARAMIPFKFIRENINLGRTGNGDVQAVIDAARRFTDQIQQHVDMVAVDTVARATPGANENDAGDMGAFVANMDRVRMALRTTVALVHHSGKNAALGARGHSSLRAAVDTELEVERLGESRILRVRKSRDGADGSAQTFSLHTVEIARDADDRPITSCVVLLGETVEEKRRKRPPPKSFKALMTTFEQARDRHGIELQLPENGPKVKAVNLEFHRNGYIRKRADLEKDNARRTYDRLLGKALDAEWLVALEMSDTKWVFLPTKQPVSEG